MIDGWMSPGWLKELRMRESGRLSLWGGVKAKYRYKSNHIYVQDMNMRKYVQMERQEVQKENKSCPKPTQELIIRRGELSRKAEILESTKCGWRATEGAASSSKQPGRSFHPSSFHARIELGRREHGSPFPFSSAWKRGSSLHLPSRIIVYANYRRPTEYSISGPGAIDLPQSIWGLLKITLKVRNAHVVGNNSDVF